MYGRRKSRYLPHQLKKSLPGTGLEHRAFHASKIIASLSIRRLSADTAYGIKRQHHYSQQAYGD